ncbi:MAG: 50S ribosomal protein L17 [Candidatus Omnitrophica bacterium]|nr:50S ribosomal protein L17 [Candidatus Omnitrophota bacterium]
MRHGISGNKFGRNQTLRMATVRDLARAIFKSERITTTRAKAIEARKLIDRIITMGKKNTLAAKRRAFSILIDHNIVSTLFNEIAPRFVNRHGGYTRIIKLGANRQGDNAEMAILELTEKAPVVEKAVEKADPKSGKKGVEDAKIVDEKKAKKAPAKKAEPKAKEEKPKSKKSAKKE